MRKLFYKPGKLFVYSYSFFILIFLVLSIYFYFNEKDNQNRANRIHLQTLAKVKSSEITRWYEERLSDASFLFSNLYLKNILSDYSKSGSKKDSLETAGFLNKIFINHDYKNIFVLNKDGECILNLNYNFQTNYNKPSLDSAVEKNKIVFSNFYIDKTDSSVDLDVYIPIFNKLDFVSTIVFKIDPDKILFPLIQNWYVPNSTAESFIVYKEKNNVVFINKLKYNSASPLTFKLPISKELASGMAVSGIQDIVEGADYRGEKVLADIRRIKDTQWFLITKQDLSEIYLPVTNRLSFILLLLFSVSAVSGIFFLYIQSRQSYRNSQKITESTKKFELLYQKSNDTILIIEKDTIISCNSKTEEIFRLAEKDIINKSILDFSPDFQPDGASSKEKLQTIFKNIDEGQLHLFDWLFRSKHNTIYCEINFSPLQMDNKKYVVAVIRDITDRKRVEDQNLRLLHAVQQSPVSIIITNNDGEIEYVNPKFSQVTGYSFDEVIGKNPRILKSGELSNEVYKNLWIKILAGGEWAGEFHNKKKNGELFWERASISAIKNSSGKITHFIAIKEDITSAKEAQESLKKMTSELLQQNKYLEQFAYIISHNLRAPVANIIGIVATLEDPSLTDEEKKVMMEGLSFSVKKLDEVIMDLNEIIQIKRGVEENKEKVCFSNLLDDITNSISGLIKKEKVEIKSDFSEVNELYTLKGYLYSIFYNLISNSIKYKRPGIPPVIQIKSRKLKDNIELIFIDNGMGINIKEKGDQVFGLYKRFHANTEGKGLGLFMTKMQVEALGGNINIKSEINQGTEFTIKFNY